MDVRAAGRSPRTVLTDDGVGLVVTDVGCGPAVLLIHAGSMSSQAWDRQVRVLADSGRRVIAYDVRGHGASDKPYGNYSLERLTADAAAVVDDAGVERVSLVGWSLGGMTALRLATVMPERITALVLVSTNGASASHTDAFPFGSSRALVEPHILKGLRENRPAYLRQGLGELFGAEPDPELLGWLHRLALQVPSWAQLACMRTVLGTDQSDLLDQVAVPTTLIVGRDDSTLALEGARFVQQRLDAELVEMECGHYPMFELPSDFDAAVLKALGG